MRHLLGVWWWCWSCWRWLTMTVTAIIMIIMILVMVMIPHVLEINVDHSWISILDWCLRVETSTLFSTSVKPSTTTAWYERVLMYFLYLTYCFVLFCTALFVLVWGVCLPLRLSSDIKFIMFAGFNTNLRASLHKSTIAIVIIIIIIVIIVVIVVVVVVIVTTTIIILEMHFKSWVVQPSWQESDTLQMNKLIILNY